MQQQKINGGSRTMFPFLAASTCCSAGCRMEASGELKAPSSAVTSMAAAAALPEHAAVQRHTAHAEVRHGRHQASSTGSSRRHARRLVRRLRLCISQTRLTVARKTSSTYDRAGGRYAVRASGTAWLDCGRPLPADARQHYGIRLRCTRDGRDDVETCRGGRALRRRSCEADAALAHSDSAGSKPRARSLGSSCIMVRLCASSATGRIFTGRAAPRLSQRAATHRHTLPVASLFHF